MEYNPSLTPTYLAGKVDEYVKYQARDTIVRNAKRDRNCRYARIPDGNACDFCKMLGSRGFVYHSEFKAGGDGNDYHPYCNCQLAVSFDPFIEKYEVVSESGTIVTVTRGYGMEDAELVRPGRDRSFDLRHVDIDELFDEYKAMGRKFTAKSKYKDYTRGAKLIDEQFEDAMRRLSEARTLDELHEAGKDIVDNWPKNENGRDKRQWHELSKRARELEKQLKNDNVSSGNHFRISKSWYEQFPNEVFTVERASGGTYNKEGDALGVDVPDDELLTFFNGRARHTHTTRIGGTFSEIDVKTTVDAWLRFHEVYDEYHDETYQLERTINATPKSGDEFVRDYARFSSEQLAGIYDFLYEKNDFGSRKVECPTEEECIEAEIMLRRFQHEWLQTNAIKYGYRYKKVE